MKNEEVNRLKSAYIGLEHELGRYRKKVADMEAVIKKTASALQIADAGMDELRRTADGVLAQVGITYGEKITDETTGEALGWRLTIPQFSVSETLDKYSVKARFDPLRGAYVLGVFPKEEPPEAATAKEEAPADAG